MVVVAAIIGFVLWRKKRAARARGSGAALVGGGNSGFKKHKDDDDEMFGNSSAGGSPFAGNEKYSDSPNGGGNGYGSMAAAGAGAAGGWGAAQQYNNHQQQPQQTRQASPTWDSSPAAYPAMNAAPASTANLLSNNNGQLSHNEIESREMQQHLDNMRQQQQSTFNKPTGATASAPKGLGMMDAGLAGAAGIGAAKIAQQQQQPEASSPFGDHPGQGSIHVVKRTFEPSLDDELVLFVRPVLFPVSPFMRSTEMEHRADLRPRFTARKPRANAHQVR